MRSVAKGNYIKGKGGIKHALAHVRYLQMRGGDDRDHAVGRKRLFISSNREGISGSEVNERIKQLDENKVVIHRIVLSPGIEGVDMDAYTRAIMRELERSKGLDIEYYATEHKNTDHGHSHVVLLGRDQHGRQVTLNRRNYQTIREAGDRYLEKHHQYSRYLDKEIDTIIRNAFKRDRGDKHFEWLLEDQKSVLTLEECDQRRRDLSPGFDKELAIDALPESERFTRNNVLYTKFSSLSDLIELAEKLTSGELERVSKEQYQQLRTWIDQKKKFGEDYFEKTAEDDRMFRQLDEEMRRSFATDSSPPKCYRQYIFESKGRLLEFHEQYEINTQRSQLQKEFDLLNQSDGDDPVRRNELQDQLDWLDELADDRIESRKGLPKMQRLAHNDKMFCVPEQPPELAFVDKEERSENEKNEQEKMHHGPELEENKDSYSEIEKLIFGDGPSVIMSQYEKTEIDNRIDLWHTSAFDVDLNREMLDQMESQARNIFEYHDGVAQSEQADQPQLEDHHSVDQIMTQQVQQQLQALIHQRLADGLDRSDLEREPTQSKDDKENEREDPGREHCR
jgi:hypothetical protein